MKNECEKSGFFCLFYAQCGNYGNFLSCIFGKNFVKVTILLNKLLKNWFDEIYFWWEKISYFSTLCFLCMRKTSCLGFCSKQGIVKISTDKDVNRFTEIDPWSNHWYFPKKQDLIESNWWDDLEKRYFSNIQISKTHFVLDHFQIQSYGWLNQSIYLRWNTNTHLFSSFCLHSFTLFTVSSYLVDIFWKEYKWL